MKNKIKSILLLMLIVPCLFLFVACGKDNGNQNGSNNNNQTGNEDNSNVKPYSEGLAYVLSSDETYYIVSGIGFCEDSKVVIPSTYKNKPVKEIKAKAFFECDYLTSVTIPTGVIKIGDYAFKDCISLTSIIIPDSVTNIGSYTFTDCDNLTNITIGNSVISIEDYAFSGCSSLTSITIPDSVTSIGESVFLGCSRLQEITLPFVGGAETKNTYLGYLFGASEYSKNSKYVPTLLKKVTITKSIGDYAFYGCSGLTSITIPNSVTSIGSYAFSDCYKLVEVYNLSSLNIKKGSVDNGYVGYYAKDIYTSLDQHSKLKTSNGVVYYINGTEKIVIAPENINATSIVIDNDCTEINQYAFSNCISLTSITIPDSVTSIGESAFKRCSRLHEMTLPFVGGSETKNTFLGYLFGASDYSKNSSCVSESLKKVTITKSIGDYAFKDCSNLTNITIQNSVTNIGDYAFKDCSSLTCITIPNSVMSIGNYTFKDCSSLTSVCYTGTIENWSNITFSDYYSNPMFYASQFYIKNSNGKYEELTEIEIPNTVTKINDYAFWVFKNVTKVIIPDSVTSIGRDAFAGCSGLTSITIPNSVMSIGDYAFQNCRRLTSIIIPDSVTNIGSAAFTGCDNLTNVTIGNGVTSIGGGVFSGCSSLKYNTYDNAKYLGNNENSYLVLVEAINEDITTCIINSNTRILCVSAFFGCRRLTEINIPNSVTSIGDSAFYYCSSLTSITIPNSVTSIGGSVFFGCSSLKYNIYDNAKYLGNNENPYLVLVEAINTDITTCTINNNTKIIYSYAFYYCSNLTSIIIPDSVISIGYSSFSYCSSLTSVSMGNSVTSIGDSAFRGCSSLKNVYYKGGESEWKTISIGKDNDYLKKATIYYYSETKPSVSGNYWHYNTSGEIEIW